MTKKIGILVGSLRKDSLNNPKTALLPRRYYCKIRSDYGEGMRSHEEAE